MGWENLSPVTAPITPFSSPSLPKPRLIVKMSGFAHSPPLCADLSFLIAKMLLKAVDF